MDKKMTVTAKTNAEEEEYEKAIIEEVKRLREEYKEQLQRIGLPAETVGQMPSMCDILESCFVCSDVLLGILMCHKVVDPKLTVEGQREKVSELAYALFDKVPIIIRPRNTNMSLPSGVAFPPGAFGGPMFQNTN